jgi:hypothetical protein
LWRTTLAKGKGTPIAYCVMVAGAAFLSSGLVFLLPTKGKRSIEEDREQVDRAHNTENLLCPLAQALLIA